MSTNRLIDILTFARVTTSAPVIPGIDPDAAAEVIRALHGMNKKLNYQIDSLGNAYRQAAYTQVVAEMVIPITPHLFGRITRQLGLSSKRMADGYHILWNSSQISILANYYHIILEAA